MVFSLDGPGSHKRLYIEWVLDNCSKPDIKPHDILTEGAIEQLAERLLTPLQITPYLSLALAKGHAIGAKPIDEDIIESVLAPDLDALEPKLARHGYSITVLCEHLNAKRSEVRAYLSGKLPPGRTEEFNQEIHRLGILYERHRVANKQHNFQAALPKHLAEQADEAMKDVYMLDIPGAEEPILEAELEARIVTKIKQVMLASWVTASPSLRTNIGSRPTTGSISSIYCSTTDVSGPWWPWN